MDTLRRFSKRRQRLQRLQRWQRDTEVTKAAEVAEVLKGTQDDVRASGETSSSTFAYICDFCVLLRPLKPVCSIRRITNRIGTPSYGFARGTQRYTEVLKGTQVDVRASGETFQYHLCVSLDFCVLLQPLICLTYRVNAKNSWSFFSRTFLGIN